MTTSLRQVRSAMLVAVTLFVCAPRADASSLILFETCTQASLCNDQLHFNIQLQPGGYITVALAPQFNFAEVLEFGFNLRSDVTATIRDPRSGVIALGSGEVGPFGTFTHRFEGIPFGFVADLEAGGTLRDPFAPFFLNALGFSMAAEIRDRQTGVTGFVAAEGLVDMAPVPEPGSMLLLATGLAAAWRVRRKSLG